MKKSRAPASKGETGRPEGAAPQGGNSNEKQSAWFRIPSHRADPGHHRGHGVRHRGCVQRGGPAPGTAVQALQDEGTVPVSSKMKKAPPRRPGSFAEGRRGGAFYGVSRVQRVGVRGQADGMVCLDGVSSALPCAGPGTARRRTAASARSRPLRGKHPRFWERRRPARPGQRREPPWRRAFCRRKSRICRVWQKAQRKARQRGQRKELPKERGKARACSRCCRRRVHRGHWPPLRRWTDPGWWSHHASRRRSPGLHGCW